MDANVADRPIVLIDMDYTLYDHARHARDYMARHFPQWVLEPHESTSYSLGWQYGERFGPAAKKAVEDYLEGPDFYATMPLIPGARQAVFEMEAEGIYVKICTGFSTVNMTANSQKAECLRRTLDGEDDTWSRHRLVLRQYKGDEYGHVLIDDNAAVEKYDHTKWDQVYFAQPHNKGCEPRLEDWADWRRLVYPILRAKGFELIEGRWNRVIANAPVALAPDGVSRGMGHEGP